jgi:7-carboxy-7-deazaguanine synthase
MILELVKTHPLKKVLLTGGEPLMQPETTALIKLLIENGYAVQVETNGSFLPVPWFKGVCWVVDYKLPSSGMEQVMAPLKRFEELADCEQAWVKFVIADWADYDRAKAVAGQLRGLDLAFSACPPLLHADLFEAMKRDGLTGIFLSIQVHKLAKLP